MTVKISAKFISANGKRAGITIDTGPWIDGVSPDLIKLRCKRGTFPTEIRTALVVSNGSDSREDYFEGDTVKLLPGDALYLAAKQATEQTAPPLTRK